MKKHLCIKDNPSNISSHDIIMGEITMPLSEEDVSTEDFSSSYSEFVVANPKWYIAGKEGYQIQSSIIL